MKNAFYYTLKALLVLKIFKFLYSPFGNVEKRLDWKDQVNFRIYDVRTWLPIVIHILINISSSKANQAMKFVQLIEYNLRNIFCEKSYTKCGGEAIHRPFPKKSKLSMSLDQQSKTLYNLFLMYTKLKTILKLNCRTILKLNCRALNFTSYKAFLKDKNRSETSLSASFSA